MPETLTLDQLRHALHEADQAVLLVPPRILRRIIRSDRGVIGLGLRVPHDRSYVLARETLLTLTDRETLGLSADQELPPAVILIAQPDPESLAARPPADVLTRYWRRLFHARIHVELDQRAMAGKLTDEDLRRRIHCIGSIAFKEIRAVLRQERYLLPPFDDRTTFLEFAAVYWEFRYFAPWLLPVYFPGLDDFKSVEQILDLDTDHLFSATRLAGARDPDILSEEAEEADSFRDEDFPESTRPQGADNEPEVSPTARSRLREKLLVGADKADAVGNSLKAAILRSRAAHFAAAEQASEIRALARAEIDQLVDRLQAALHLPPDEAARWKEPLATLLTPATRGLWPAEARFLYDLQKICVDHERPVFALHFFRWVFSLGKKPLQNLLPGQTEVLTGKHLRAATRHLLALGLTTEERGRLTGLVQAALHHAEERLRELFRPKLVQVLEEIGLRPANLPERVAHDKLIEELLDLVVERGYFNMSQVRDALSRNQLKLSDLSTSFEFLRGDPLLRADRLLVGSLEGVYHPGEIYVRGLQRISSVGFGTWWGRLVTLFLVIPFGAAFVALEGLDHMLDPVADFFHLEIPDLAEPASITCLGIFLFLLLHLRTFRRWALVAAKSVFATMRALAYDLPAFLFQLPAVQWLLASKPFQVLFQYFFKPLLYAGAVWVILALAGVKSFASLPLAGAMFLAVNLFLNSRLGREVEDIILDRLAHWWHRLSIEVVPALIRWILDIFKQCLESLDRFLYTIDEWLRFRQGQGRGILASKLLLGLVWGLMAYLVRFYVTLLIEPTINPVKHFPTVTVAAKIMVPFYLPLTRLMAEPLLLLGFGTVVANSVALFHLALLPGVFGFLVWELKENWRLYRANRPRTLRPVVIGSHGETMIRLLRPGIHSGTIAKLFARLRRAVRRAAWARHQAPVLRQRVALAHVRESLQHFVAREFLALLNRAPAWQATPVTLKDIHLTSNSVRFEFLSATWGPEKMTVVFFLDQNRLAVRIQQPPRPLGGDQQRALTTCLVGWLEMAGADEVLPSADFSPATLTDNSAITWQGWVDMVSGDVEN